MYPGGYLVPEKLAHLNILLDLILGDLFGAWQQFLPLTLVTKDCNSFGMKVLSLKRLFTYAGRELVINLL